MHALHAWRIRHWAVYCSTFVAFNAMRKLCLLLSLRCPEPQERDKKIEKYNAAQEVATTLTKNQTWHLNLYFFGISPLLRCLSFNSELRVISITGFLFKFSAKSLC